MQDVLKDTQIFPFPFSNVVPSPEKLCQAMVAMNDQANLQPTLNKGAGDASFTIFVTDSLQNQQNFEEGVLKSQKFFFEKVTYL